MVKSAFFRANIPFAFGSYIKFDEVFMSNATANGWKKTAMSGGFLLKHINTSLEKNVVCFIKDSLDIRLGVAASALCVQADISNYDFRIDAVHVYCFDTGIGFVSFHIPYDTGLDEDVFINTCSVLRCSAKHPDIIYGKAIIRDCDETYLSCIAEEELHTLIGSEFSMFNLFDDSSLRRIDMFSAALCDINIADSCDRMCYLLANTFDTRDKTVVMDEREFCRPRDYTRWNFSKRGCAVVSNLTGVSSNDDFLEKNWLNSVKTNYFYVYLMVLHQKYAIYNYLNTVASDSEKDHLKYNQESLIDFNSKYIFTVVSDEQFIQNAYIHMKETNSIDEVYTDLLDELKRLFEYGQLKSDEINEQRNNKLNYVSVIISIVCSLSVIFDTITFFTSDEHTATDYFAVLVMSLIIVICIPILFITTGNKK